MDWPTQGFAFVEMRSETDAEYAIRVLNMVELFGRSIRVNKAAEDKTSREIGASSSFPKCCRVCSLSPTGFNQPVNVRIAAYSQGPICLLVA